PLGLLRSFGLLAVFGVVWCLFGASDALAVTRTWDGGGVTENWSEAANWSSDTVATFLDAAVFDGTSSKDATIDQNISMLSLSMTASYGGTVTQASGASVSITSSASIAGGVFQASNAAIGMSSLAVSGGTFHGDNAPMTIGG